MHGQGKNGAGSGNRTRLASLEEPFIALSLSALCMDQQYTHGLNTWVDHLSYKEQFGGFAAELLFIE